MDQFSSREVALFAWGAVALLAMLGNPGLRVSLYRLARATLNPLIAGPALGLAVYTAVIVFALAELGVWSAAVLKDTVYWYAFVGLVMFGRSASDNAPTRYWGSLIREHFAVIVLFTFVINTYTFPLPIELLLVPLILAITLLGTVAELKPEHAPVARFTGFLQGLIGWGILGVAAAKAVGDTEALTADAVVGGVLLPLVLTVCAMPYMYAVAVYSAYNRLWVWTGFRHPPQLARYMRRRVLGVAGLSLDRISRLSAIKPFEFMQIQSASDFDELMARHANRPDSGGGT
jgi:hypothetical protein